MPAVGILAVLGAFLIMVHLGFASAAALASTMIPIIISIVQEVQIPGFNAVGMVMVCQFMVSFGMILPVNAPQNMVSYSTGCFEVKDFMKVGIPLTIIGYLIILFLGATYWNWLGIIG
jgi:di/tricarboxylate transporter